MRLLRTALLLACVVGHPGIGFAQTAFPLAISGNTATAAIQLPGGLGVDLTISFEQAVGLNADALDVTAQVVSPLDLGVTSRLPAGATLPAGLPVLIRIEPTAASALSFSGVATVGLYTHNLNLDAEAPLGLFSSSAGGPFREITRAVAVGSYRVDGSGGGFSEFVITRDPRPIDTVISDKFGILEGLLSTHAGSIGGTVATVLQQHLALARSLALLGLTKAAIGELTAFGAVVTAQSGALIPDVWRANDDRINVAGLLRAACDTLKFSLTVKANQSP
jgi:hypothetical protein